MMKYAVLVAYVALSLHVDARVHSYVARHDVEDNEVSVQEFKLNAPWKGNPDEGYPKFDGNPIKQSLVDLTSMLAHIAADALEDEINVPPVIMAIVKGAQKTNWASFDEYLNYLGSAQVALIEAIEGEQPESKRQNLPEFDVSNDDDDESD